MTNEEMVEEISGELRNQRFNGNQSVTEATGFPSVLTPDLFSEQVRRTPEAIAVVWEDKQLTYAQLESCSNQLAHFLRRRQAGPETLIGLCVERSPELIIGLLGILKAGAGYVPLDPTYPSDRLAHMMSDAKLALLLTQAPLAAGLPASRPASILLDSEWAEIARSANAVPDRAAQADDVAYVIYTSGSTGKPKGVVMPHGALANQLLWLRETYPLGTKDVMLQKTPFSFDASIWEILLPLVVGAKLVLAKVDGHRDAAYLCEMVRKHGVTALQLVPSMLRVFLDDPQIPNCVSLRHVFSGGEALTRDICDRFFEKLDAQLHNLYGPTETCIQSLAFTCWPGCATAGGNVPIGKPIYNTWIQVVDERLEPVTAGAAGELLIGGAGLARGYFGRPDLTAERFVRNSAGERMYRTGDLVRSLPGGDLEFLGRMDHQLKLRGYRIEPGEIEVTLRAHPTVRDAAVVLREGSRGEHHLAGYIAAKPGATVDEENLHRYLRESLPEYMDVSTFTVLDKFPLLPNGKVDRSALPAPAAEVGTGNSTGGRTPVEQGFLEIWSDVLKRNDVGVKDDFFDLGGTSLELVTVFLLACERFGTAVDVSVVSEGATIASLARFFEKTEQG
jgi:amino acid adenylation domain-containing protein